VPFFCISYRPCTPVVVSSLTPRMPRRWWSTAGLSAGGERTAIFDS
jgi:hypothetical protein